MAVARGEVEITGVTVVYDLNAGCALGEESYVEDPSSEPTIATVDNVEAMSSASVVGEFETGAGPAVTILTLAVEPAGTYGIE